MTNRARLERRGLFVLAFLLHGCGLIARQATIGAQETAARNGRADSVKGTPVSFKRMLGSRADQINSATWAGTA